MAANKNSIKGSARLAGLFFFIFFLGFLIVYLFKYYNDEGGGFPVSDTGQTPIEAAIEGGEIPESITPPKYKAKAVIIIDDMGYSVDKVREIVDFELPITIAVIPFLPHSEDVAYEAGANGLEVMLHLPMEPSNLRENDPGKGALLTTMSSAEIRSATLRALRQVPGAVGINNHMGSKFTQSRTHMDVVIAVAREKGLFFIDSKTSPKSVAEDAAREAGLKTVKRNVFLDNEQEEDYIRGQIERFKKIALSKGVAVAIGHPYSETLKVLREEVKGFEDDGIELVTLSEVIF